MVYKWSYNLKTPYKWPKMRNWLCRSAYKWSYNLPYAHCSLLQVVERSVFFGRVYLPNHLVPHRVFETLPRWIDVMWLRPLH